MTARRTFGLSGALLAVVLVVSGAVAYACTNLATLNLSSASGKAGDTVTVTGSSFRMPAGVDTGVQIRWNAVDGPVLAEVRPDRTGNISADIVIPQAAADNYVVVAVLRDAKGADTSGTPARAQFQVVGGAGRPVTAAAPQVAATGGDGATSSAPVGLLLVLGLAGIGLFGAGIAAVARQTRGGKAPVAASVPRD